MDKIGLRKVIDAVRKAKPKEFRMELWKSSCGTAGCAIGHFCMRNPKDKLKLIKDPDWEAYSPSCSNKIPLNVFKSIARRFGIKEEDAELMFDGYSYANPTKRNVIRRIESFIKTGKVKPKEDSYA